MCSFSIVYNIAWPTVFFFVLNINSSRRRNSKRISYALIHFRMQENLPQHKSFHEQLESNFINYLTNQN